MKVDGVLVSGKPCINCDLDVDDDLIWAPQDHDGVVRMLRQCVDAGGLFRPVAMAAMPGLLFHINHIHFHGFLSPTYGVTFEQLSNVGPFEAWNLIPLLGQMQIIFTIAGLEHASECLNPAGHYTKGGIPGDMKFAPFQPCPVANVGTFPHGDT